MTLAWLVPLSTAGMDQHPACVTGGASRDGVLLSDLHAWQQEHGQRLGGPRETPIHWGPTATVEGQELSGRSWPIRSRLTTAAGWDADRPGQRHACVPVLTGLCLTRHVSPVAMRAGVCRSSSAGIGCRKAAWLLEVLCPGRVGTSSLDRWIATVAEDVPRAEAIVQERHRRHPITAGHCDGDVPRGRKDPGGLVLRDAHGRIVATEEGKAEDADQGKPLLARMQRRGVGSTTFSIDHSQALRHASTAVDPEARRQ